MHRVMHPPLFTVPFVPCLCPEQAMHGSPYHVHPYPSPVRLQHAFQSQNSPKMFHPKGLKPHLDGRAYGTPTESPILGRALCLTPRGSPVPGRVSHLNDKFQDSLTLTSDTDVLVAKISAMFPTVSETHIKILLKKAKKLKLLIRDTLGLVFYLNEKSQDSLILTSDTDVLVAKISSMLPTASETHIKVLLKKYYNREAVVISALQVEKHPITTPGPVTMSPCAARLQRGAMGVYTALQFAKGVSGSVHGSSHFTPYTGSPHGSPSLFRPASGASSYGGTVKSEGQTKHQSPKMKLKYLKSIFPKAEETLILDVLANKDNNVQKASEELITMGFPKKETIINLQKKEKETPQPPKKVVTIMKTLEEKNKLKQKLQKKYNTVPERVVGIALESVDYNEERAEQILDAVLLEEEPPKTKAPVVKETKRPSAVEPKKGPILKATRGTESKYKSQYRSGGSGPNPTIRQGAKDSLLLKDYLPWNGPNPDYRGGSTVSVEGPEPREQPATLARGATSLAKGPAGIAKGSVYQKLTRKSAKV